MNDLNKTILIGRLVRNPELKSTPGGTSVCRFTLANNYSQKKPDGSFEKKANFIDCIAFGKMAETINRNFSKGQKIALEGALRWSSWEDNTGQRHTKIEVLVQSFNFLERKNEELVAPDRDAAAIFGGGDDDIPF